MRVVHLLPHIYQVETVMKWRPWRRAPRIESVPAVTVAVKSTEEVIEEAYFNRLGTQFATILWAQEVLRTIGSELDSHCARKHDYFSDCDPLCGPNSITELLQDMSREELHNFTTLLIKQWYACYVTLRFQQNQGS